jgi:ABC-type Co2+ transport system permease subunit
MLENFTLQNLIKYALEGIAVSVAAFYLTSKKQSVQEVLILGLIAAITFLILDLFAPSVGAGARHGSGFGIGYGMVGGADEEETQ